MSSTEALPTTAIDTVSEFKHAEALQATATEGLASSGLEPTVVRITRFDILVFGRVRMRTRYVE